MRTKRTGRLVGNDVHPVQYRLIRFVRVREASACAEA
jgi:hypothetical protein